MSELPTPQSESADAAQQEIARLKMSLANWQTVAMDLYEALPDEIEDAKKQFVELAENVEIPASRRQCEEMRKALEDAAQHLVNQMRFGEWGPKSHIAILHARITAALAEKP